jgi:hypothetical protein
MEPTPIHKLIIVHLDGKVEVHGAIANSTFAGDLAEEARKSPKIISVQVLREVRPMGRSNDAVWQQVSFSLNQA